MSRATFASRRSLCDIWCMFECLKATPIFANKSRSLRNVLFRIRFYDWFLRQNGSFNWQQHVVFLIILTLFVFKSLLLSCDYHGKQVTISNYIIPKIVLLTGGPSSPGPPGSPLSPGFPGTPIGPLCPGNPRDPGLPCSPIIPG